MKRRAKKVVVMKVDDLFQDRDHTFVDIKNLTLREFKSIAYALRSYAQMYGVDGPDDSLGINIVNLSSIFDDGEKDIDSTLLNIARGEYHG